MAQGQKRASAGDRARILTPPDQSTRDPGNKRGGAHCRSRSTSSFHADHVATAGVSTALKREPNQSHCDRFFPRAVAEPGGKPSARWTGARRPDSCIWRIRKAALQRRVAFPGLLFLLRHGHRLLSNSASRGGGMARAGFAVVGANVGRPADCRSRHALGIFNYERGSSCSWRRCHALRFSALPAARIRPRNCLLTPAFFLVALAITLRAFHAHRARQDQN